MNSLPPSCKVSATGSTSWSPLPFSRSTRGSTRKLQCPRQLISLPKCEFRSSNYPTSRGSFGKLPAGCSCSLQRSNMPSFSTSSLSILGSTSLRCWLQEIWHFCLWGLCRDRQSRQRWPGLMWVCTRFSKRCTSSRPSTWERTAWGTLCQGRKSTQTKTQKTSMERQKRKKKKPRAWKIRQNQPWTP